MTRIWCHNAFFIIIHFCHHGVGLLLYRIWSYLAIVKNHLQHSGVQTRMHPIVAFHFNELHSQGVLSLFTREHTECPGTIIAIEPPVTRAHGFWSTFNQGKSQWSSINLNSSRSNSPTLITCITGNRFPGGAISRINYRYMPHAMFYLFWCAMTGQMSVYKVCSRPYVKKIVRSVDSLRRGAGLNIILLTYCQELINANILDMLSLMISRMIMI